MSLTNGNVTKNDASNAETELALRYIGENYKTEEVINHDIIAEYKIESIKYFQENGGEAAQNEAKSIVCNKFPDNKDSMYKEFIDIESPKSPKNKDPDLQTFEDIVIKLHDSVLGIEYLLKRAMGVHYNASMSSPIDDGIYFTCATLCRKDYKCEIMGNQGGSVCWNYPANIHIPIGEKVGLDSPNKEKVGLDSPNKEKVGLDSPNKEKVGLDSPNKEKVGLDSPNKEKVGLDSPNKEKVGLDSPNKEKVDPKTGVPGFSENFEKYCKTAKEAAVARCRCRFPVPVILCNGKFICRSGTLAVRKGAVYQTMTKASEQYESWSSKNPITYMCGKVYEAAMNFYESFKIAITGIEEMKTVDSSILDLLNIRYICDLMVEDRKSHTAITVSSSETVNVLVYGKFRLVPVPYPGCEFFKEYQEIRSNSQYEELKTKLIFNWRNPEVTKAPELKMEKSTFQLDWTNYETWDLETLTKNYIRLILHYFDKGDGGILVHCISGWDRTPLFICLLRVSLWADNLIHKSLDVVQMAYFTLGYDWYLFGHNLPTRQEKKEEIMHFCFKFLPCIASKEFSINHELSTDEEFLRKRKDDIEELSKMVLDIYDELLDKNKKESSESENPATEE